MDMADLPSSDNTSKRLLVEPCCACTIKLFHCAARCDTFSVQTRRSCNLCDGQYWHQLANLFTDRSSKSYVLLDWAVCVVLATTHAFKHWLQQHGCASCALTNRNSITFVSLLGSAVHSAPHPWILLSNVLVLFQQCMLCFMCFFRIVL